MVRQGDSNIAVLRSFYVSLLQISSATVAFTMAIGKATWQRLGSKQDDCFYCRCHRGNDAGFQTSLLSPFDDHRLIGWDQSCGAYAAAHRCISPLGHSVSRLTRWQGCSVVRQLHGWWWLHAAEKHFRYGVLGRFVPQCTSSVSHGTESSMNRWIQLCCHQVSLSCSRHQLG